MRNLPIVPKLFCQGIVILIAWATLFLVYSAFWFEVLGRSPFGAGGLSGPIVLVGLSLLLFFGFARWFRSSAPSIGTAFWIAPILSVIANIDGRIVLRQMSGATQWELYAPSVIFGLVALLLLLGSVYLARTWRMPKRSGEILDGSLRREPTVAGAPPTNGQAVSTNFPAIGTNLAGAPRTNGQAVWSLVLGILSLTIYCSFLGIPAVVCGHVARSKIRKTSGQLRGKGMALAGLIMGYIGMALFAIIMICLVVAPAAGEKTQSELEQVERQAQKDHAR